MKDRVRVTVRRSDSLGDLDATLRNRCSGNIGQTIERLRQRDDLSLVDLAAAVSQGAVALVKAYGFSQSAAEKIAQGGLILALEIEECEIPAVAALELNVGSETVQSWKELDGELPQRRLHKGS